ncbi:MAG: hypothetical protein WCK93_12410, partial [Nitrosomonadales bacterium]
KMRTCIYIFGVKMSLMTLQNFIQEHGDEHCSALFDVKLRTVAGWRRGEAKPRSNKANAIVKLTDNKVTLEGIYGEFGLCLDSKDKIALKRRKDDAPLQKHEPL